MRGVVFIQHKTIIRTRPFIVVLNKSWPSLERLLPWEYAEKQQQCKFIIIKWLDGERITRDSSRRIDCRPFSLPNFWPANGWEKGKLFLYILAAAAAGPKSQSAKFESREQLNLRNGIDHVESHFHAAVSVIRTRFRQSGHAIVAVSQQLDAEAMMLGRQTIKPFFFFQEKIN